MHLTDGKVKQSGTNGNISAGFILHKAGIGWKFGLKRHFTFRSWYLLQTKRSKHSGLLVLSVAANRELLCSLRCPSHVDAGLSELSCIIECRRVMSEIGLLKMERYSMGFFFFCF